MRAIVVLSWIVLMMAEATGHGSLAVLIGISSCGYLMGMAVAGREL